MPHGDEWLTAREIRVLAGLHVPKRRSDWRLGRFAAKRVLRRALGVEPADVAIVAADDGAPEAFVRRARAHMAISIGHSHGRAIAVAGTVEAIGCDVEFIEQRADALVRQFFTAPEQRWVVEGGPAAITLVWACKEAALKVLRAGLRLDTRTIEVGELKLPGAASFEEWLPVEVGGRALSGLPVDARWRIEAGFVYAVVAPGPFELVRV